MKQNMRAEGMLYQYRWAATNGDFHSASKACGGGEALRRETIVIVRPPDSLHGTNSKIGPIN